MVRSRSAGFSLKFESLTARKLFAGDVAVAAETDPGADVPAEVVVAPISGTSAGSDPKPVDPKPVDPKPVDPVDGGPVDGGDAAVDDPTLPADGEDGDDDIVAIYDNDDGVRPPGIADSDNFENAADQYATSIGDDTWEDVLEQVEDYVNEHGLIDELHIFDHGYTGPHTQQYGDGELTPEQLGDLEPYLAHDADLYLEGCTVGQNAAYCNDVADETGSTVYASEDNIYYNDSGHYPGQPYQEYSGNNP